METLRRGWNAWKRIGQKIGDTVARVVLTVFYFTVFMPFGLGVRLWGDPLSLNLRGPAKWLERKTQDMTLKDSRRL